VRVRDDEPRLRHEPGAGTDDAATAERTDLHRAGLPGSCRRPHRLVRRRRYRWRRDPDAARLHENLREPLVVEERGDAAEDVGGRWQRGIERPHHLGAADLPGERRYRPLRQHRRQQPHDEQEPRDAGGHTRTPIDLAEPRRHRSPAQSKPDAQAESLTDQSSDEYQTDGQKRRAPSRFGDERPDDPRRRPHAGEQPQRETAERSDLRRRSLPPASHRAVYEQEHQHGSSTFGAKPPPPMRPPCLSSGLHITMLLRPPIHSGSRIVGKPQGGLRPADPVPG
jgi:hypothetical protein